MFRQFNAQTPAHMGASWVTWTISIIVKGAISVWGIIRKRVASALLLPRFPELPLVQATPCPNSPPNQPPAPSPPLAQAGWATAMCWVSSHLCRQPQSTQQLGGWWLGFYGRGLLDLWTGLDCQKMACPGVAPFWKGKHARKTPAKMTSAGDIR